MDSDRYDVAEAPADLVHDDEVGIRRMRDVHEDYELIARWRSDDRVLEFYGGRDKPLDLKAAYDELSPRVLRDDPVRPCIISLSGESVGYIQYNEVSEARSYHMADSPGLYGIDMFIGEPEHWDHGLGTRALALLVDYLFDSLGSFKVVIDPHVKNPRAVRSYEKAGFKRVKVLRGHESHEGGKRDAWLMEIDREMWAARPLTPS